VFAVLSTGCNTLRTSLHTMDYMLEVLVEFTFCLTRAAARSE